MIDFINAFFWLLVGIVWLLRNLVHLATSSQARSRWLNLILPPISLSIGFICLHVYWSSYTRSHDTDNFGGQPSIYWQLGAAALGLVLPPLVAFTVYRLTNRRVPHPERA
jgi:hypothetical protein